MKKKNLVPLTYLLQKINKNKKLRDIIVSIGYAKYPHKYFVLTNTGKKINFGHQDYQDTLYRTYKNYDKDFINEKRRLYRLRHKKGKNQHPMTPGFLSYYLLW